MRTCRQGIFLLGLLLVSIYEIKYKLWLLFIPSVIDTAFMIILLILKIYFDNYGPFAPTRIVKEVQLAIDVPDKVEKGFKRCSKEYVRADLSGTGG